MNDNLHDDMTPDVLNNEPPLEQPAQEESVESHFSTVPTFFVANRHQFELLMACFAMAGLRNPKEKEIVPKIAERAQMLADHYEDRGFFAEGSEPLRLEYDEPEMVDPVIQHVNPPQAMTKDGRSVRVIDAGLPSQGVDPRQLGGKKAVTVGMQRRPPIPGFVGRSTVNATNGSHRPGAGTPPQKGVQVIRRQPPPPRNPPR